MNRFNNDRPPRWVLAFFRWFCRPEMREYLEGDLLELYHHRRTGLGLAKARWLLIKDVLLLFRPSIIGTSIQPGIMKNIKWTRLILINVLVALMILSPFMPGPSNKLVLLFSVSAQTMGLLGLALVPLGLAWIVVQANPAGQKVLDRIAITASLVVGFIFLSLALILPQTMPKISFLVGLVLLLAGLLASWRYGAMIILAVATFACLSFVLLILLLAVFVGVGVFEGFLAVLLVGAVVTWMIKLIMVMRNDAGKFRQLPFYLVTIPMVSLLVSQLLMTPASHFSRDYAIERTKTVINALEAYKTSEGQYPGSLDELASKYPHAKTNSFIMGVDKIRYTKINDQFTLSFSQWLDWGSLEEIVLYANDDVQKISAMAGITKNNSRGYDYKNDLWRIQGAFAIYDTKHPDWQYYHCD
jgi:hypothetical protein